MSDHPSYAAMSIDDLPASIELSLRTPLAFPGLPDEAVSVLQLREPTAGELRDTSKQGANAGIFLIAKISGVAERLIERMCARDFQIASEYLTSFTPAGQTTGRQD